MDLRLSCRGLDERLESNIPRAGSNGANPVQLVCYSPGSPYTAKTTESQEAQARNTMPLPTTFPTATSWRCIFGSFYYNSLKNAKRYQLSSTSAFGFDLRVSAKAKTKQ